MSKEPRTLEQWKELLEPRINTRMAHHYISPDEYDDLIDYHLEKGLPPVVDTRLAEAGYCNIIFLGVAWEIQ